MIAVGIGDANEEELRTIASDPDKDHVFHVSDFSGLLKVEKEITERACQGQPLPY